MKSAIVVLASTCVLATATLAQTGIDGVIGSEWTGATSVLVPYPVNADQVAYRTYFRTDASYAYFAVSADSSQGGAYSSAFNFANFYIGTNAGVNNSNIGMEVTNDRFFVPGVPGYYNNNVGTGVVWSNSGTGTIELAIPFTFFTSDPLGMGIGTATHAWFRTSQSFGYNFVSGASVNSNSSPFPSGPGTYALERFGIAAIPTPGAAALMGVSGLAALRRRRTV